MIENSDFRIEEPDLSSKYDVELIRRFLSPLGFYFDAGAVDYSIILYNLNDDIVGVGSYQGKILKYLVVAPEFRESGAFAHIVTFLTEKVISEHQQAFVFTRPENINYFTGLGYNLIATAEPLIAVLEFGYADISRYCEYLKSIKLDNAIGSAAAIVMNCNPFTLGHQYLVEKASEENEIVYLFVVEEDRSTFKFTDRWNMIKAGTRHLSNVIMVKGGEYVVSEATFPSYFLKNESTNLITQKQAELDITIFCQYIAPTLNITARYVGTECYCSTTELYNTVMQNLLPKYGIDFCEIKRKEILGEGGKEWISASKVRDAIVKGEYDRMKLFLPSTTIRYLNEGLVEKIRHRLEVNRCRH
ncbi:[citrate (pro-3S)-lyase] ligase [Carboxylicivirga caseinilyticus]|uniref:[citrate (pro-3S)-lyase] ligase n=1 Tax=Carboxylicivirga caseinilyticus TaxID=3417572 RepID=UPI003D329A3E|nr:[citrate (pro-3S)-lyase] ligase [Marinilabiliaceae bacterium A049]